MTYKEWSEEYYKSAEAMTERIEKLKMEMKTAPAEMLRDMGHKLNILREMRWDCLTTARLLASRKGEC